MKLDVGEKFASKYARSGMGRMALKYIRYVIIGAAARQPEAGSTVADMEPLQRGISGSGPKAWI
jgi:hypothetical protein